MNVVEQAESIYNAYPKHVGRRMAIKAIIRALDRTDYHRLLERTKEFSEIVSHIKGTDKEWKWVPHPSTWYNQDRWDDDFDDYRIRFPKKEDGARVTGSNKIKTTNVIRRITSG